MSTVCNSANSLTPKQDLERALKVDAGHRYDGVECDVYGVETVKPRAWDYSLPTLVRKSYSWQLAKNVFPEEGITDSAFQAKLAARFPYLLGLDWNGVLLAGGAVQRTLSDDADVPCDVDLFLYGMSETAAVEKVKQIARHVSDGRKAKFTRTERAITISMEHTGRYGCDMVQIILRIYKTQSEILHGFDLGSSAVGWTGTRLLFTSLSRFAYSYGLNVFDNSRRSTTYERRISKYMLRGFGLVVEKWSMPDKFNVGLSRVNKYLRIAITDVDHNGNRLQCNLFADGPRSDYGPGAVEYRTADDYAFHVNIANLVREDKEFVYVGNTIDEAIDGKCITSPVADKVNKLYDDVLETFSRPKLMSNDYAKLKYMMHTSHVDIINKRKDATWLIEAVEMEREFALRSLRQAVVKPMTFLTENPGTQMTSSFNPVFEDERAWYGKYYRGNARITATVNNAVTGLPANAATANAATVNPYAGLASAALDRSNIERPDGF